jgi:hypothetical protein
MRRITFTILFISSIVCSRAQENKLRSDWEIEVDPIAYILKGYSLHGIYQSNHLRYDLGVFGIQQPEKYHGNEGYTLISRGFGAKLTWLIKGIPGFYTGLGSGLAFHEAKNNVSKEKADATSTSIGALIGYRFFFRNLKSPDIKGFYVTPWVSFDYNYYTRKFDFADYTFRTSTFSIFPTIHLGYRF